jgi:hypothetical protein
MQTPLAMLYLALSVAIYAFVLTRFGVLALAAMELTV